MKSVDGLALELVTQTCRNGKGRGRLDVILKIERPCIVGQRIARRAVGVESQFRIALDEIGKAREEEKAIQIGDSKVRLGEMAEFASELDAVSASLPRCI